MHVDPYNDNGIGSFYLDTSLNCGNRKSHKKVILHNILTSLFAFCSSNMFTDINTIPSQVQALRDTFKIGKFIHFSKDVHYYF